ncbi:MAG: PIN domain-containing protein [Acidimicrobiales bacterium]
MTATPITLDVNVFVAAMSGGHDDFHSWPSPPPVRGNLAANAVGILNDAREFSLWTSPHILRNTIRVLVDPVGFRWDIEDAKDYAELIVEIAQASGGGIVDPEPSITECPDYEDNRILECAAASDSVLIVTNDVDLTSMSPWRGTPIIHVRDFVQRVDAARRRE